jgi:hypothetical protein
MITIWDRLARAKSAISVGCARVTTAATVCSQFTLSGIDDMKSQMLQGRDDLEKRYIEN